MFQILEQREDWRPLACYIPKNQKALELQMFSEDYVAKSFQLEQFRKEAVHPEVLDNNIYYLHLEWLMKRGEDRICKLACPHCGGKPVSHFRSGTVVEGGKKFFSSNHNFLYCEDCVKKVDPSNEWIYPFKFSSIKYLYRKFDHNYLKEVIPIFKYVFGLRSRLTKEEAFEFFNKDYPVVVFSDVPIEKKSQNRNLHITGVETMRVLFP